MTPLEQMQPPGVCNAKPNEPVLVGTEGARGSQDASRRGNSAIDWRYSRLGFIQTAGLRPERRGDGEDGIPARILAPLEGRPIVKNQNHPIDGAET